MQGRDLKRIKWHARALSRNAELSYMQALDQVHGVLGSKEDLVQLCKLREHCQIKCLEILGSQTLPPPPRLTSTSTGSEIVSVTTKLASPGGISKRWSASRRMRYSGGPLGGSSAK